MKYRVELTRRAVRDLSILYEAKNAAVAAAAHRWFNGIEKAAYTLAVDPYRRPLAPENANAKRPLRHLLYGRKPHV